MIGASIATPHVDWLALAPSLALIGASGVALLGSVLVPAWMRHAFSAVIAGTGFVTAGVFAGVLFDRSRNVTYLISDSMTLSAVAFIVFRMGWKLALIALSVYPFYVIPAQEA